MNLKTTRIKNSILSISLTALSLISCQGPDTRQEINLNGKWLFQMDLKKALLPFEAELIFNDQKKEIIIFNDEEVIKVEDVIYRNDSIIAQLPVFESEFILKVLSESSLEGVWINYYKSADYKINVVANKTEKRRFEQNRDANQKVATKYEVSFSPNKDSESKAIGLFQQNGNRLKGTFATETGDYRYLDGAVIGDSLFLSTFDGSHAFYFSAHIQDSSLSGVFYSGTHFEENWEAVINPNFELRDPDSLTFSSDTSAISFQLENAEGDQISLNDEQFSSKVKLIQIMGSWCPNCLDESLYFKELKKKYTDREFEIIAVAFERTRSKDRAIKNIQRLATQKELNYPILLGGFSRDHHPTDIFPMLNHIMSYPTTLYLDRDNKIRKIHTGFYGPGTGKFYEEYKEETESFIEDLLSEN